MMPAMHMHLISYLGLFFLCGLHGQLNDLMRRMLLVAVLRQVVGGSVLWERARQQLRVCGVAG